MRGSAAVAAGLVTRGVLRGPRFRRLYPDVYVAAGVELDLIVWSRAAYLLVEHRGGALGGWSAATLLGAACAPARVPPEVVVPTGGLRAGPRLVVRRERLPEADMCRVRGCRVTSPLRTAWGLARRLSLVEAVVAVDALAGCGGFAPQALLERRGAEPAAGCRALDAVVALCDPRAESVMETRLRLLLVLAGLPRPEVQYRVLDAHGFVVARLDLAYPQVKLAIEYDGGHHFTDLGSRRDRRRDLALSDLGWHTMRFTRDEVDGDPPETPARVGRWLRSRGLVWGTGCHTSARQA